MPIEVHRSGFAEMPSELYSLIPDAEVLLALEPEELAGILLELWNREREWTTTRTNFSLPPAVAGYPEGRKDALRRALMEAWAWLEREGLIIRNPEQHDWFIISRRGAKIRSRTDLQAYRDANALPRQLLHPVIVQKSYAPFLRGDYETAVFAAFREVEIAVRAAGDFAATDLGTDLMRKAFNETAGPLTDMNELPAEKQALSNMFAGAIGRVKNPSSHRHVQIGIQDAVELITLASHLMKIVDERAPK